MNRMVRNGIGGVALLGALSSSNLARAELGEVAWFNRQCGLIIIKSGGGYTLAQHTSPGMLSVGDMLVGDFGLGSRPQDVKNASTRSMLALWLDQQFGSLEHAFEKVPPHCRPEK